MTVYQDTTARCGTCEVRLRRVGGFGALEDPVLLRDVPLVERDSRGQLYATVYGARDQDLIRYAPSGDVLGTIGRHGRGPGEFQSVWDILVGPGDTLFVGHESRISVFDSSGVYVRGIRLEGRPVFARRFVAVREGRIVLTESRASETPVLPLQAYDEDGRHVESFGPPGLMAVVHHSRTITGRSRLVGGMRRTAWEPEGAIWLAGGTGGYRVEHVGLHGRVDQVIGVEAPAWWNLTELLMTLEDAEHALDPPSPSASGQAPHQPREMSAVRRPSNRPQGIVRDIGLRGKGSLLVLLHVPAEDWQHASAPVDTTMVPSVSAPGYQQQLYDTIIDVIDTRTGAVLARRRMPGTFYLMRDGALYRPTVEANGVIHVDVFDIDLEREPDGLTGQPKEG